MRRDPGKLSKRQLRTKVKASLVLQGLEAYIFEAVAVPTLYSELAPELEHVADGDPESDNPDLDDDGNPIERPKIKILLEPQEGLVWNGTISYEDKLDEHYDIVTLDVELPVNTRLKVVYPDGKYEFLRILEANTAHPYTEIAFCYKTQVI